MMKGEKKPVGAKAQIRATKEKERRIGISIFLAVILLITVVSAYFTYTLLNPSAEPSLIQPSLQFKPENSDAQTRAAIVDHLSLTAPNQTFTENIASILTKAGYIVDYFDSDKTTVGFYRNLPTVSYSLIVFRVHAAYNPYTKIVGMFTSEPYSTSKYLHEQLTEQLLKVTFNYPPKEGEPSYFGITPSFVKNSMKGKFQNTAIIMMGCDGLKYPSLAEAFIEKGAKLYISWDGPILITRDDPAITCLLQQLITEKQSVERAILHTMIKFKSTPTDESKLLYYPLNAGEQRIKNIEN